MFLEMVTYAVSGGIDCAVCEVSVIADFKTSRLVS